MHMSSQHIITGMRTNQASRPRDYVFVGIKAWFSSRRAF
jgi:hypothetical protein